MKINDIVLEDGRIVPGVNTTDDVGPDEIKIQAKKMGFEVTKDGIPPLLYEEVDVENIHFQMMSEAINKDHTLYENLNIHKTNTNIFNFVNDYNVEPIIGNSYIYCSIFAIGSTFISKSVFKKPYQLINIQNNKYTFDINGIKKTYPEYNETTDDLLKQSILFNNNKEYDQFNTMFELKFGEIKSSTKHLSETYKYAGNCVNSFDSGSGDCITSIFNDVSDFAVQEENAKIISKEEFDKYVSGYNLETSGNHEFQFYSERNIFALYDIDNDIHYFFSE